MEKNFFFPYTSMVVFLADRQCQVPSLWACKWKKNFFLLSHPWWSFSKIDNVKSLHQGQVNGKKNFFFAFTSMVALLEDRQCQVPSPRASKWEKKIFFFLLWHSWWSYSKIDNVKSLHQGQVNRKNFFCFGIHGGLTRR